MFFIKLLTHLYNFFKKIFIALYINNGKYKAWRFVVSKEESKDIIELLAKKRNIEKNKSKSSHRLYNIFKKQSKNKKKIDDIREELKNPKYNILKSELKNIRRNLYNIEKQRKISLKKTSKY